MKTNQEVKNAIREIADKYGVLVISATRNIQTSVDVELEHPIYYKEQEKMEDEIRGISGVVINDIFYHEGPAEGKEDSTFPGNRRYHLFR